MIFRSGVFSRKDGISETQFGDHWFQVHGHLASFMPGVHRYFQNHIRERLFEGERLRPGIAVFVDVGAVYKIGFSIDANG